MLAKNIILCCVDTSLLWISPNCIVISFSWDIICDVERPLENRWLTSVNHRVSLENAIHRNYAKPFEYYDSPRQVIAVTVDSQPRIWGTRRSHCNLASSSFYEFLSRIHSLFALLSMVCLLTMQHEYKLKGWRLFIDSFQLKNFRFDYTQY